jgi:hypothetical protein
MLPARLSVAIALLLLALAIAWRALSDPVLLDPGDPRGDVSAPTLLAAHVEPIGDFTAEFNINHENPFVPFSERRDEKTAITKPKAQPVAVPIPQPTGKPMATPEVVKPTLPKREAVEAGMPECLGVLRHGLSGQSVLLARLPGKAPRRLAVGDDLDGWQLTAIGQGVATFRTPAGGTEQLPVGGTTPVNVIDSPAPAVAPGAAPPAAPLTLPAVPAPKPGPPMHQGPFPPPPLGGANKPPTAQAPAMQPAMRQK